MSTIAYVTDEKMLEYHRLCRHRTILFWRLSSKKNFSDFRKGDILFFFAKARYGKKKGLIGYAHFDSIKRLSISSMWRNYGERTGYDSEEQLRGAIEKAARGEIPKKMSCLYLTGVVFFVYPVYPDEVGIQIPANLESYCYIDRNDPGITVRILEKAARNGIDLWSADPDENPQDTFHLDEIRHKLAMIHHDIGKESGSESERIAGHRLMRRFLDESDEWELIRGSRTDCFRIRDHVISISLPFVYQANDKDLRSRDLIGRIMMYRICAQKNQISEPVQFNIVCDKPYDEVKELVDHINGNI